MRIATDNLCLIFLLLCSFISRSPNLSRLFSSPISVEPSASAWLWQGHLCGAAEFVEIIFFSSSPFPALNNTILPVLGTPRRIKKKKELRPTSALRRLSNPQAGALSLDCCLRHHSLLVVRISVLSVVSLFLFFPGSEGYIKVRFECSDEDCPWFFCFAWLHVGLFLVAF